VPVAVNCWVAATRTVGLAGVTAIDTRAGGARTVTVALPLTPLSVAEMVAVPGETEEAKPAELMVATLRFEEAHVTLDVRLLVLLSE
jgi:hypothetical protein